MNAQDNHNMPRPSHQSAVSYTVRSVDGLPHKFGISKEEFPKFFVRTNSTFSPVRNIIRELLHIEYQVSCRLVDDAGNQEDGTFSIITLQTQDKTRISYFEDIFTMMLRKLNPIPSIKELSAEVESLIAIFNALTKPPKKKMQGLWAELLILEQSKQPEVLINAWHTVPSAKYDFVSGRDKLEVKSCSSIDRNHKFSIDQLNPPPESRLLIASIVVQETGPGCEAYSVKSLFEKIRNRMEDNESRLRLYTVLAETLGADFSACNNVFFDYKSAVDSLAFYDWREIPSISKDSVPPFVSNVNFTSNLSNLVDVRKQAALSDFSGGLFSSII